MKRLNVAVAVLLALGAYQACAINGGGVAPGGGGSANASGAAGGGHAADGGSHFAGGVGHSSGGPFGGVSRVGAQVFAHGSYVEGKDGAPSGIRESFGGKEAVYVRAEVGGKASVVAVLDPREKITKADEAMLVKAGWKYQPQPEKKPPERVRRQRPEIERDQKPLVLDEPMTWCRDLPPNKDEAVPADGFFCVQAQAGSRRPAR